MSGFHIFLDELIKTSLITDSLNGVHEVGNLPIEVTYFVQPKQAVDGLRKDMLTRRITILEHDDLFFSASSNNEPYLEVFRFKQEEFISNDELSLALGLNYTPPCSQHTYEDDIRIAKQRILERRKTNVMLGDTV